MAELEAILDWVRQAADSAHPDTDVSDFGQSFPLVRKIVDLKNEKISAEMMLSEVEQERDALKVESVTLFERCGTLFEVVQRAEAENVSLRAQIATLKGGASRTRKDRLPGEQ